MRGRAGESSSAHVTILNWRDPWHPEGGGSELYIQQVARRLKDSGTAITWVTAAYPGAAPDEVRDGIRFIRRGNHISVYLWTAWLLLTRRIARVGSVLEVQNGMPFLAAWLTRRRVVVLVHHVHREQWSVLGPMLSRVGWFMESRVAVRANQGRQYVAVSEVTRNELVELGVRFKDIRIAYNGIPPEPVYTPHARSSDATLVVLSRLVPHKRIEHAIAALPPLVDRFPEVQLRIMGSGWWRDRLEAYAEELGVTDRVTFLGHVDERTKHEELSRAWLHLMPSVKEGWGLSIMEAARAGVPSLAYADAGGVSESVLDGVTGVLAFDEDDFQSRLAALIADPARLVELGAKARTRTDEFTWEAAAVTIHTALTG